MTPVSTRFEGVRRFWSTRPMPVVIALDSRGDKD